MNWQKVTNASPADHVTVLFANAIGQVRAGYRALGYWYSYGVPRDGGADVTHWMPLPAPPEEDEATPCGVCGKPCRDVFCWCSTECFAARDE